MLAHTFSVTWVSSSVQRTTSRLSVATGHRSDIAAHLFLSSPTVEYHLRKVYRKLSVASRAQFARYDRRPPVACSSIPCRDRCPSSHSGRSGGGAVRLPRCLFALIGPPRVPAIMVRP
jgi:Bacterial regulatory proteins, luxR family